MVRLIFRIMFRLRRRFSIGGLIVLVGLVLAAGLGIDTYRSFTYQFFTLLFALLFIATLFSFSFQGLFEIRRELPQLGSVGEKLEYSVIVYNQTAIKQSGLFVCEDIQSVSSTSRNYNQTKMREHIPLQTLFTSRTMIEKPIPPLLPYSGEEVRLSTIPSKRGFLIFEDMIIGRPDPFNLIKAFKKVKDEQSLMILPKRYQLPPFKLPGSRRYQPGGVVLAHSVGDSEEFKSLRDYRPGDPLRRIHWRSWAKVGKPIIKEFEEEFYVRHALILDTFLKDQTPDIFEEAISLAASFVCTVETRESLLDLMFVGPEAYCFTAGRGLNSEEKMLEILASVSPCFDKEFDYLIPLVGERVDQLSGCLCIFLNWDNNRRTLLNILKGLNIPTRTFIVCKDVKTKNNCKNNIEYSVDNVHFLSVGNLAEELLHL